jgi:hypothetical protein
MVPSKRHVVQNPQVDSPMMLWIELHMAYAGACDLGRRQEIQEIQSFATWSLQQDADDDLSTAAIVAFFEHLLETPAQREELANWFTLEDFEGMEQVFGYHFSAKQLAAHKREFLARRQIIDNKMES